MPQFFLGIMLPAEFTREVEEFRRRFRAPKTPPHITLIPPFTWRAPEAELVRSLTRACGSLRPFELVCRGIDTFGSRVIFIAVEASPQLMQAHGVVSQALEDIGVEDPDRGRPYHPHLTLATRLAKGDFHRYMEELDEYNPDVTFICRRLALFKMFQEERKRRWKVYRQLLLGGEEENV